MVREPLRLPLDQARAAWILASGVDRPAGGLTATLERTGFVRTLGGVDVYVAVRARLPDLGARELEAAVAGGEAQVIPAVRGCIYLVGRRQVAAALRLAELLDGPRTRREYERAGIRNGELESVCVQVLAALAARGPSTTDGLRRALPEGCVRSLGEAGKKVGLSSTLPPALRRLELAGAVARSPDGGRLDRERYLWRLPRASPFAGAGVATDRAGLLADIAEVFLRAAGLGAASELAAWAGVAERDARAALAELDAVEVAIDGLAELRWALPESRPAQVDVEAARAVIGFLPFEDNLVALQGGPGPLIDPAHHGLAVPTWGPRKPTTLGEGRHALARTVVAEGRIAGLWEYDPDRAEVVYRCFAAVAPATAARLDDRAAELGRFLTDELGHGRSFSVDTDEDLRRRAAWVAGLGAAKAKTKTKAKAKPARPARASTPAKKAGKAAADQAGRPGDKRAKVAAGAPARPKPRGRRA